MRVLIVHSANAVENVSQYTYIYAQASALRRAGCEVEQFGIQGKGFLGYLRNLPKLRKVIRDFQPDLIHAHYGLSGLLATLQHQAPVVITFHGSDVNTPRVRPFSRLAAHRAAWNIFVSPTIRLSNKPNSSILPCGIDFSPAEEQLGLRSWAQTVLQPNRKHVLFAGAFDNPVKNATLAKQVAASIPNVQLIELKGYSREQVYALMYACDALLLTSHSEGSPQVIKEAMACDLPIVSTNVGDVIERLDGLEGCFVAHNYDLQHLVNLLRQALSFQGRTLGRERIIAQELTNNQIAKKLIHIYNQVLAQ